MKRILLTTIAMLACMASFAKSYTVRLASGECVSVEACSDAIFRVRVSPDGVFSESLMERYGIIRTDWKAVAADDRDEAGTWSLKTATHTLTIDKASGTIKVCDASGAQVIGDVHFVGSGSPLVQEMAGIINEKYADMHVTSNGGIIGDDNGKFSEKDKAESGDPDKSSIITVALADGERFYGGGGTSRDHIQHRGEMLRMWTTYQHTEIPMPFLMSSRGWGIYDNTTRKNFFDVASVKSDEMRIYNTCSEADFYLMACRTMPEVLDAYTQITGRTYVLPKWAYGFCFGPNMREDQWAILNDAVLFRQVDVPCDLFWLEPQWMETRYDFSTSKKFNSQLFSVEPYWLENKPEKQLYNRLFIGKLRSMGYHLGLWLCEEYDFTIQEEDEIAAREGREQSGQEHWMDHLKKFMDLGVEGFKLDPARTIDEHTYWDYYNGRTDKEMHNLNQVLLPKQMAQLGRGYNGKRTWHHYCGGWSGTQHWTASTSGDNGGGKTALYDQLNLGMSGFMNTSCDVMSVERELEMQSLHFGFFLPWVQVNSWFSMMHPFYYDQEEQTLYRNAVKTRYEILPYIYSAALEGALTGMPIVRAMPLMFPDDRNCDDMAYQYMFGQNFLVGIFTDTVYLPKGTWIDYWTGEKISSKGENVTRQCPADRAGLLFVREGAIIPCQEVRQYIGTKPQSEFTLKIFPSGKSSYTLYDSDAESYGYEKGLVASTLIECSAKGSAVEVTINPVSGSFEEMPSERTYSLEVAMDSKPSKITVNGAKTEGWNYADGKVSLSLGTIKASEKVSVVLK